MGGLSGCESMHLSGPENRTSPLCKSARGSASAWSSWTAVSWGRDSGVWDRGWAGGRHPFWGRGSNGCKNLTRSKLEEPFLWLLFPATSSPLSVERERSRRALDPLLFLSCRSGGRRRRRVQRYLGSGALALRRGVASGWAWTPSRLLSPSRLRGGNGRCRFRGLLSRRSPGATLSSCWAGALGQEVSHSLWRLLCLCEALSESFHRRSKEAAGGNWSIKEGDPVRVLNLRQREPQVALEHYQAGHRPSYGLGGSLGGSQSQVRCTSQFPESRRIRLRLIYGREELGLIDLENRHRVERRSRLSSWSVGASSERWSGPAWLGRVIGFRLPADGSGWAEMCSHWLIQLRHPLISLFFSAVNCSEGGWSGSTEAGRVRGAPRSRELVVNFREERRWSLLRGLTAPRQKPLIQMAARGLLWWRPLQTQLFNRFWEDTEKFGIHPGFGGAGRGQTWGGGVSHWARQLLSIWSYQWHAVIGQLIVTSPERDQIAHACRGTLVRLGKKDGRHLSVWRKRGTRDLSRRELALNRALRTSDPLFFPHRSLGGRKREGARGGVALWKESDPRAQRGETDALAVRTIRASERGICMGFPQAGNTLAVTVIGVQGGPARTAVTARHYNADLLF